MLTWRTWQINQDRLAGDFHSTLDLGLDRYRQVALLEHPDDMTHQRRLIEELHTKGVLRTSEPPNGQPMAGPPPGVQLPAQTPRALNFVTGWDASAASYIILTPTIISILVSIIWPAVAVQKYDADVQTSVQTGMAVASYIVTAGEHVSSLTYYL